MPTDSIKTLLSKEHLLNLFEAKKMKQTKIYIDNIVTQNYAVEKIVVTVLNQCLVQKKSTPMGITSALYFYRELVLKSQFDLLESQGFPQKIHHSIYMACLYNPQTPIAERGTSYFKDNLKVDNQQETGIAFIILALEIIQAMAMWYPEDFFNEEPSRYKQYYDKLISKKVIFPQGSEHRYMKPTEQKKFKQNLERWKKQIDEAEDKEEEAQKIAKKQDKKMSKQNQKEKQMKQKQMKQKQMKQKQMKQQQMRDKQKQKERQRQRQKSKLKERQLKQSKVKEEQLKIQQKKRKAEEIKMQQNKKKAQQRLIQNKKKEEEFKAQQKKRKEEEFKIQQNKRKEEEYKVQQSKKKAQQLQLQQNKRKAEQLKIQQNKRKAEQLKNKEKLSKQQPAATKQSLKKRVIGSSPQQKTNQRQKAKSNISQAYPKKQLQFLKNERQQFKSISTYRSPSESFPQQDDIDLKKMSSIHSEKQDDSPNKINQNMQRVQNDITTNKQTGKLRPTAPKKQIPNIQISNLKKNNSPQKYSDSPPKQTIHIYPPKQTPIKQLANDYHQPHKQNTNQPKFILQEQKVPHQTDRTQKRLIQHKKNTTQVERPNKSKQKYSGNKETERKENNDDMSILKDNDKNIRSERRQQKQVDSNQYINANKKKAILKNERPRQQLKWDSKSPSKRDQYHHDKNSCNRTSKHNSLRKTQKRNISFENQYFQVLGMIPNQNNEKYRQNRTLSHFRSERRRGNSRNQQMNLRAIQPIFSIIENVKLDKIVVPFLPEYFEPLDYKMHALMTQSLRIGSSYSPQPSKAFFRNQQILTRLIKTPQAYILSIQNVSMHSLQLGYSQKLQTKYGDQFSVHAKIKGYETKKPQELLYWKVHPQDFIDIRFQFRTTDPNFKFLQLCFLSQKDVISLYLPITLLDQGYISSTIDHDEIINFVELNGKIIKSQPLALASLQPSTHHHHSTNNNNNTHNSLPSFFGYQNKSSRILGQMNYRLQIDYSQYVSISFFIKQYTNNTHQIIALYDRRRQQNQDYAKVILQLLCLLLNGKIKS